MTQEVVNLNSLTELTSFATQLKEFIVKQKLFTNIQGKNYVNVEGWEYAGACTGILPVVRKLEDLSTTKSEIKFRAEVELVRLKDNQPVGFGIAICSNLEAKRRGADEYVIASMAQTRAIGKAYRNMFGFLMKMAGYQPTPAEEAEVLSDDSGNPDVYEQIKAVKTRAELAKLLASLPAQDLKAYVNELEAKQKELNGGTAQ
jgi:hypothetical protein